MNTKCCYCGRQWKEVNECCASCGAPAWQSKIDYFYPFFDNGYIVYPIRNYAYAGTEFHFYKGITYIGKVFVTENFIRDKSPAEDISPYVLEALEQKIDRL